MKTIILGEKNLREALLQNATIVRRETNAEVILYINLQNVLKKKAVVYDCNIRIYVIQNNVTHVVLTHVVHFSTSEYFNLMVNVVTRSNTLRATQSISFTIKSAYNEPAYKELLVVRN